MRRIKQITITKLFGMFNYVIPLHLDDRITIIHGPNGFGKTIILKLLSEIFKPGDLQLFGQGSETLRKIPFDEFRIEFDDDSSLWMVKTIESLLGNVEKPKEKDLAIPRITFYAINHGHNELPAIFNLRPFGFSIYILLMNHGLSVADIHQMIPELERTGDETWRYRPTNESLSLENVIERFGDRLPIVIPHEKEPKWLLEMREDISTYFIETERLFRPAISDGISINGKKADLLPTITIYSQEITEIIKTKLADSVALTQSLDRTFPSRIANPQARNRSLPDNELRNKLADLETKRLRLIAVGLLDKDDDANFQVGDQIDEGTKTALSIYVEDTEKKLAVFNEIADKIDTLINIVNKRFLYKQIAISKEQGFVFTTENGTNLLPTDLSSGEQHQLVMFYELLFKVAPGSLILIDEPELSLHVVWQEHFLHDVQEITRLSDIDVLLATHSPDIINDRRDLMVELEGPK